MIRCPCRMVPIVVVAALFASGFSMLHGAHQDLPKGEELMDKYIEVTGGKAAYEKVKTRVTKGSMSVAGATGDMIMYQKAPNLMYMAFDLQGFGKIEAGTDGNVVWEKNPITGAKLREGAQKEQTLRSAAIDSDVNWRKYYKSAKTTGTEQVNGKEAYVVELITTDDKKATRYFDKNTGLLLRTKMVVESDMGEVETDTFVREYKKFDGILTGTKIEQNMLGQTLTMELKSMEHNVEIPAARFEIPNDVKELLKDKK